VGPSGMPFREGKRKRRGAFLLKVRPAGRRACEKEGGRTWSGVAEEIQFVARTEKVVPGAERETRGRVMFKGGDEP